MKALAGAFNQEKALVGAFSMIVQLSRLIVYSTTQDLFGRRQRKPASQPEPAARNTILSRQQTQKFLRKQN